MGKSRCAAAATLLACASLVACSSPPPGLLAEAARDAAQARAIQVEPRKIDLPVGADPDFDQTDPLGTGKKMSKLLERLKERLATKSAEPPGSPGDTRDTGDTGDEARGHTTGEAKGKPAGLSDAADATALLEALKDMKLPDIDELLGVVASASAQLATWGVRAR